MPIVDLKGNVIKVRLTDPVRIAGEDKTELTMMRKPTIGILRAQAKISDDTSHVFLCEVLQHCFMLTEKELDQCSIVDFGTMSEAVAPFLPARST